MEELTLANSRDLTEEEMYEIDGGWVPLAVAGVIFVGGAVAGYIDEKNKK
jgi:lactobin A/cerein 7B family class IIb bacteriocin